MSDNPARQFSCVPIIEARQQACHTRLRLPRKDDRVGFVFTTKDRVDFTLRTLASVDDESGFDLLWADGSDTTEGKSLPFSYQPKNTRVVEAHTDVRGGPDRAIQFGLRRLLALGYEYCGLIENDMIFEPGWFQKLMELFRLAAQDGLVCGAATVRSYESRVIEYRDGYNVCWNVGAGMVLFSRPAAQLILDQYPTLRVTARSVRRFYADFFGIDLGREWDLWLGRWDRKLGMDWGYSPLLFAHGFSSVGSIPSRVEDLAFDVRRFLGTSRVGPEQNKAGLVRSRINAARRAQISASAAFFAAYWIIYEKIHPLYRFSRNIYRRLFPASTTACLIPRI
jgi:hypothetical protein